MASRKTVRKAAPAPPQVAAAIQREPGSVPPDAQGHWQQFSRASLWLNDRALPMSGLMLSIAMLYMLSFIQQEKVPLSITSSTMITALPSLFVLLVLLIALLTGFLLSPTLALFTPMTPQGSKRLIDLLQGQHDKPSQGRQPAVSKAIIGGWLLSLAPPGVALGIVELLPMQWLDEYSIWLELAFLLMCPALAVLILWVAIRFHPQVPKWRETSWSFRGLLMATMLPQLVLMTYVVMLAARATHGNGGSLGILALCTLTGAVGLGLLQLAGARLIAVVTKPGDSLAGAALLSIGLVALLGIYPPSGALLAGAALQITASGARTCAVLSWTPEGAKALPRLKDSAFPNDTLPLRILVESDGHFLVRAIGEKSKRVDFIPRSVVTGIHECPAVRSGPPPAANPA